MSGGGAGGGKGAETVQEAQREMSQSLAEATDSVIREDKVYAAQRGCGGKGAAAAGPVPRASRKLVRSLKEIVNRPEAEIYEALLDCDMDPDEAVRRLLSQDTLHQEEVKMKPDSKEVKGTPEPRSRAEINVTTRGVSEPGMASTNSTQKQTVPTSPVNQNLVADTPSVPPQTSSVFQHGWSGTPAQLSMADVMEMGRPQAQGKPSIKTVVAADTEVDSVKQVEMSSSMAVTSAMDAPMSSSLGAMGPLLRKLDSLLPPGYWLPKLLKDRIQLLKADLEEISVALLEQSMVDSPNEMAKYWMNEVRELCYDIEDFIDNMMSTHAEMRLVRSYKVGRVKIAWLPKTLKPCTRAAKIAEFSTLVQEASERHDRYLDGCTSSSSRRVFTGHGRIPALYAEAGKYLVGVDDSKAKLIKWLTDEGEQQLKVVAIVGPAGVGKTTLAKQVYHELGEQFECRAFVRGSRKPDMRRLLGGILSQVQGDRRSSDSCTVQNLIEDLTEHLQDKRYVIVIDDLWEKTAWDIVTSAFPEGNNHSRIITTAEIGGAALEHCDYQSNYIIKMKPLGREDSGELLSSRVGPERLCPELTGVLDIIITKCAGLPLAIICVAGLLTSQPGNTELWQHVEEFLCANLSKSSTLEETLQEVLNLSYNCLPHYLKTCLMYLSMYPEGYTMWKVDLVKLWIAEGFICETEGTEIGEVADSYFGELVNRGMIQPVYINYNAEVLSCTLHHVVLDLITHESNEENFITALDYSQTITGLYSTAHRLSLHFSNTRYAMKPTGPTLSKVRSLGFFGILQCVPSVVEFKLLRVLILEFYGDHRGSTSFNLTRICRLVQLRYLKISCDANVEIELPTQVRMLRYLETLIIDAVVSAVPLDVIHLPSLWHLSLGNKIDLPDEIGRIRSLRTLHYFDVRSNSEDNVMSLGNLINLQDLHLIYYKESDEHPTEESDEHLKRNLRALVFSLAKLVNLKSVTLAPGAPGTTIYLDVQSSMSSPLVFLQRLELLPPICIFSRLPEWTGQLQKLCILKVVVSELLMKDMDMLIRLPALTILSLYVQHPTADSIIFKRGAFLRLKYFKYTCGALPLIFQEEAFPNLQRLELSFNAQRGVRYDHFLSGIGYLLNLTEIVGTIGAAAGAEEPDRRAAESAFKDAIRKHPRFPSYGNVKRVDRVCEEYQLRTQEKDSSIEKHETLQKEQRRKEGDSSDDQFRILLEETKEDTKQQSDRISHFPATGSIISFDQMKIEIQEKHKLELENLTLSKHPFKTLHFFMLSMLQYLKRLATYILSKGALLALLIVLVVIPGLTLLVTDGQHKKHVQEFLNYAEFLLWWVSLGVASSIGLGSGLHTFVLYLGPHIALFTITAVQCGRVDLKTAPYDTIQLKQGPSWLDKKCSEFGPPMYPASDHSVTIPVFDLLPQVQLEAVLWGIGTALGELPPYFISRAARLSSTLNRRKNWFLSHSGHLNFFTILILASVPNPLSVLTGTMCGQFGIPFWKFFFATLIGNAIIKTHIQTLFIISLCNNQLLYSIEKELIWIFGHVPGLSATVIAKLHSAKEKYLPPPVSVSASSQTEDKQWNFSFALYLNTVAWLVLMNSFIKIITSTAQDYCKMQQDVQMELILKLTNDENRCMYSALIKKAVLGSLSHDEGLLLAGLLSHDE